MIASLMNVTGLETMFADLATARWVVLSAGGIAFVISIILTFLIKWTARCVVWTMIIVYLILVAGIGTIAYM